MVVVEDGDLDRGQPSARRRLAVLPQMRRPGGGHRDERAASRLVMTLDEASRVLPYAVSVTILKEAGFEWTSRSAFGFVGSLAVGLAPENSR